MSRTGTFLNVDSELTAQNVARWRQPGPMSSNMPIPDMPTFSVKSRTPLRPTFERMGTVELFTESSEEFSGVDAEKRSPMQSAAHHAMFSLTAQGFEAAAATAAGSAVLETEQQSSGSAPSRAVVFLLQDAKTGLILLIGRMR